MVEGAMFTAGETREVWSSGLLARTGVVVDETGPVGTFHSHARRDRCRVVLKEWGLEGDGPRDLAEVLVRAAVLVDRLEVLGPNNVVQVPLLGADFVDDYVAKWQITDRLRLTHEDRRDIYFEWDGPEEDEEGVKAVEELDADEAMALLRAVASVQEWCEQLEMKFASGAVDRRREVVAAVASEKE